MLKNGFLFLIITALCFTAHEPVSKLIAGQVDPNAITAIRFFISGLILLPFAIRRIKRTGLRLTGKDVAIMGGLGILQVCVSMVLLQTAIDRADSPALIAIIFSANSIVTILLSALFLKNKLTAWKLLGITACIAGVLIGANIRSGSNPLSVVLASLSTLTFSIYTVLNKKLLGHIGGIVQTSISFLIGSTVLLVVLLISGVNPLAGITPASLPALLLISVVITGLGYYAYFSAADVGGVQMAATAFFIKPVLTPFATWLINGIVPGSNLIAAVILVVLGAILANGVLPRKKAAG